jgi:hypothetical protein
MGSIPPRTLKLSPKTGIRLNTRVAGRPAPAARTQPASPVSPAAETAVAVSIAPLPVALSGWAGSGGRDHQQWLDPARDAVGDLAWGLPAGVEAGLDVGPQPGGEALMLGDGRLA